MEKRAFIDFAALRERVPILGVLERYNVRLRAAGNSQYKGRCPLPSHTSKGSKGKETFCELARERMVLPLGLVPGEPEPGRRQRDRPRRRDAGLPASRRRGR